MKQDYYEVLGVSKNATEQDIKSAFRKLSRKWHPDMQAGKSDAEKKAAEEKFKSIAEAYEVLSDKDKRANYDQFGFDGPRMSNGGFSGFDMGNFMRRHSGMFSSFFSDEDFGPFSQFNNTRQHNSPPDVSAPEEGRDVRIHTQLPFSAAIFGCVKEFEIDLSDECPKCHGKGIKDGAEVKQCAKCGGSGTIMHKMQRGFMTSITTTPCPDCQGLGFTYEHCEMCNGAKRVPAKKKVSINIPAGIESGQKLRVRGRGECGTRGASNGDLYVVVTFEQSDIFGREGLDITVCQPISPIVATLGGKIDVPSPHGWCKLKIPECTKSGTWLSVPGKGIKSSAGIGDLKVNVIIEPLSNLSKSQQQALEEISASISLDNLKMSRELKAKADKFIANAKLRQ